MKKKVLVIGLLCETVVCLYVPLVDIHPAHFFLGYGWLWKGTTNGTSPLHTDYVTVDISRLAIEIIAIALLTAVRYLLSDKRDI